MSNYSSYKERAEDEILFKVDYERFIEYQFSFEELLIILMIIDGYNITEISLRTNKSRRHTTRVTSAIRAKFLNFLRLISC